jgi:hypothetical protein
LQTVQKTFKRIYFYGKLIGEFTDNEGDLFNKKMHELMLKIGRTPEEQALIVATFITLSEATM